MSKTLAEEEQKRQNCSGERPVKATVVQHSLLP